MEDSIDLPPNVRYFAESPNDTTIFSRTARKRAYCEDSATQHEPSSDPALFSSDEPAASAETYASKRRKQFWQGTWWGEKVDKGNASRKFARNFDSGVFLSSDSADSDLEDTFLRDESWKTSPVLNITEQKNPLRPKQTDPKTQTAQSLSRDHSVTKKSASFWSRSDGLAHQCPLSERTQECEAIQLAKSIITQCVQDGRETVDLSSLRLGGHLQSEFLQLKTLTKTSSMQEQTAKEEEAYQCLFPDIKLFLANNQLKWLAKEVFELENLVVLSVRQNELKRLPDAFRCLTRLEELNVSGNQLDSLPHAILNLIKKAKLRKLSTFPNPFKDYAESEMAPLKTPTTIASPTLVAESQPIYYWKNGRLANIQEITRQFPQLRHGYVDKSRQSNRCRDNVPKLLPMLADQVPSLTELALIECSRQENFFDYADYLEQEEGEGPDPNCDPDKELSPSSIGVLSGGQRYDVDVVADMLKKAQAIKLDGGKRCGVCNRNFIIQRVTWYEWHRLSNTVALRSSQETERSVQISNVIPFYREACSLVCYLHR